MQSFDGAKSTLKLSIFLNLCQHFNYPSSLKDKLLKLAIIYNKVANF